MTMKQKLLEVLAASEEDDPLIWLSLRPPGPAPADGYRAFEVTGTYIHPHSNVIMIVAGVPQQVIDTIACAPLAGS